MKSFFHKYIVIGQRFLLPARSTINTFLMHIQNPYNSDFLKSIIHNFQHKIKIIRYTKEPGKYNPYSREKSVKRNRLEKTKMLSLGFRTFKELKKKK